jgi:hypothetical protein
MAERIPNPWVCMLGPAPCPEVMPQVCLRHVLSTRRNPHLYPRRHPRKHLPDIAAGRFSLSTLGLVVDVP